MRYCSPIFRSFALSATSIDLQFFLAQNTVDAVTLFLVLICVCVCVREKERKWLWKRTTSFVSSECPIEVFFLVSVYNCKMNGKNIRQNQKKKEKYQQQQSDWNLFGKVSWCDNVNNIKNVLFFFSSLSLLSLLLCRRFDDVPTHSQWHRLLG